MQEIIAIGNAIIDIVCKVDDIFLKENNLVKGSMSLIDEETAQKLSKLKSEKITSGGSAANTIATLANLQINSSFIGKVANDEFGKKFIDDIAENKVQFLNKNFSNSFSAKSFILITPDGERTMCTFLGCAPEISEDDIKEEHFKNASILYLEGYLWDSKATIAALRKAINLAKKNNVKIAFSLSDSFCVIRHKEDFLSLIKNDLDLLFANESEVLELISEKELSLKNLAEFFQIKKDLIAVITRSDKGCAVFQNNKFFETSVNKVKNPTDTTGAGDAFAAGFFYGFINNHKLKEAAEFGNILASNVIQKLGARLDKKEIVKIINDTLDKRRAA
ncbi:MAG: adenosine kinase [Rickettsiales bacterium]|nr:adenosine kinase [Rickettsiales bacterium]